LSGLRIDTGRRSAISAAGSLDSDAYRLAAHMHRAQ
jgi:hypothetical protein